MVNMYIKWYFEVRQPTKLSLFVKLSLFFGGGGGGNNKPFKKY